MEHIKNERWRAIGRDILFNDALICTVNAEDGARKFIRALERADLIAAAAETARKLAEAEAQARELAALLAEYFEDFEDTAEARAKNETYAKRCSAALRPMGYYLRNMFDEEAEQEGA